MRRSGTRRLLEDPEVPEQPPEDEKDQDGAEAAAAQLLGAVARGHAAQELAHGILATMGCMEFAARHRVKSGDAPRRRMARIGPPAFSRPPARERFTRRRGGAERGSAVLSPRLRVSA